MTTERLGLPAYSASTRRTRSTVFLDAKSSLIRSFPRKRESSLSPPGSKDWVRACAGTSGCGFPLVESPSNRPISVRSWDAAGRFRHRGTPWGSSFRVLIPPRRQSHECSVPVPSLCLGVVRWSLFGADRGAGRRLAGDQGRTPCADRGADGFRQD